MDRERDAGDTPSWGRDEPAHPLYARRRHGLPGGLGDEELSMTRYRDPALGDDLTAGCIDTAEKAQA